MANARSFALSGLWRPRRESIDVCAQRLHRFFMQLCESSPRFEHWFRGANSKKKAMERPVDVHDLAVMTELLLKGRNRTDAGKKVIEELGFRVSVWNGAREYEDEAGASIGCGAYCKVAALAYPNSVSVRFPKDLREFADWRQMYKIMKFTAKVWEPDFLTVFSRDAADARESTYPFVDWMLYLSQDHYQLPKSPPAAHVEQIDNLGTLIVVQDELPDPANEEHNQNIHQVRLALGL